MKVLVLGGGVGGHVAANLLRKRLSGKHSVTLIDKKPTYEFAPSFPRVMLSERTPNQISRSLERLERKGIRYINGKITRIDEANRLVKTVNSDFSYDYLVVSLGADLDPTLIPGLSDTAHHNYDLESTLKFKTALEGFAGGRIAIGISSLPFKCPAAPYETALLLDYYFRKRGLRDKIEFQFFTPEPLPMPVAGPTVGNMVKALLEQRGIHYRPKLKLIRVDTERRMLEFEDGEEIKFDLLFAIPPHLAPAVARETGLVNEIGWVAVDNKTLRTRYDDVYAIGDVTSVKLPNGKMLPKAGVFAHGQAKVVAQNIYEDVEGGGSKREWDGWGSCFLETGHGKSAYASGNFYLNPPTVKVRKPGRIWRWGKTLFERYWLWRWF